MTKRIAAGFRFLYYGVVDQNGYFVGNTASGAVAGVQAGEGMLRLKGAQTAPVAVSEDETVNVLGDDGPIAAFNFPAADLPNGVIEMAVRDSTFEALVQGTAIEVIGDLSVGVLQPSSPAFTDMCLLLQRRTKKQDSGVQGVKAWEALFLPRAVVTPLYSEFQQRANTPYRYSVTTSSADRKPWGATLTEAANGAESAPLIPIDSDNPLHLHAFKGDNSQTDFDLAFTPKSAAKIYVYLDGNKQTLTTQYTVSGSTITFVSAPGTDAQIQVLYEVDESNLI